MTTTDAPGPHDFVVVGSGAGGGTVAARLAEAGFSVLVLEAGGDPREGGDRLPDDYDVPAFHPFSTENPAIAWDFFVRHYADEVQQRRDPKCGPKGIFYPRAGTLGGCTAHNAMIFIKPEDAAWDAIAALTGDASWQAAAMNTYARRLEQCRYRPEWRLPAEVGLNPTGHGWHGWLPTELADPRTVFGDDVLLKTVLLSARVALHGPGLLKEIWGLFASQGDPNDRRDLRTGPDGLCFVPLTTDNHRRTGTRERLLDVASRHPDRLRIETHALATSVRMEGSRATGVDYRWGERLYRAHPVPGEGPGEARFAAARHGVILAGGAFNTPQLLMLSGVGPPEQLTAHGIPVRVANARVGRNLQDRYEVSVVSRMAEGWRSLAGCTFAHGDAAYQAWADGGAGMYATNGAALAVARRSSEAQAVPDLFCMALLADFAGYEPGYSRRIAARNDCLSWVVLKAQTLNRSGTVTLRSADPRDTPLVTFNSFDAGSDPDGVDLAAAVEGIRFVRSLTAPLREAGLIAGEETPGDGVSSDDDLAGFVRDNAWGHHASCSCAIGAPGEGAIDAGFAVHGTAGLWVVDASVFPRIPGFFIASAIFMAAEKAADVIAAAVRPR